MLVTLRREWYEKCRIQVLNATFSYKDYNKGVKEKTCESREEAIAEAEKFKGCRLKTGSWEIVSETREDYYLNKMVWLESRVKEESSTSHYDAVHGYVTRYHPAEFSELEKLTQTVGCSLEEIPRDYQNFLLTLNGFDIRYRVEKDAWGSSVEVNFVATYTQQWFQEHKTELTPLQEIQEPFIVVSNLNRSHEKKSLSGGVLLVSSGMVVNYDEDTQIGEFTNFRDYLGFESLEIIQRLYDAKHWVDRKAG
jgi:hypothetical protein